MSLEQRPRVDDLGELTRHSPGRGAAATSGVLVTRVLPTRSRIDSAALSPVGAASPVPLLPTRVPGVATDSWRRRVWALLAGDLVTALALSVAVLPLEPHRTTTPGLADLLVAAVWVILLASNHAYDPRPVPFGLDGVRSVTTAGLALVTAGLVATGLSGQQLGSGPILVLAATAAAAAVGQRWIANRPMLRGRAVGRVRVVVAGHRRDVDRVLAELRTAGGYHFQPVAVCLSGAASSASYDLPVLRGLDNLVTAASRHGAGAVIVAPCRHLDPLRIRRLGWDLEAGGTQLFVAAGLLDVSRHRTSLGLAGALSVVHVRQAELRGWRRLLKHIVERTLAGLALLLLAPLLMAVAVVVRTRSAGPALYRQTRVGRGGVAFSIVKFRTMTTDSDALRRTLVESSPERGVLFKLREDPRVTPEGRFLRRYSLDELPQLINVVRGEMSLVGPRPPLPCEVAQYEPDAHRRLAVTPGMTGLWQVSGRSDLSWEESLRLDLRYVDNWSLGLDLRIIAKTAHAVLSHRGAY